MKEIQANLSIMPSPDYARECWAMKRAGIPGKWHMIVVPWSPRWLCHSRIYYTDADNYVTRFGDARLLVTCKLCLRQPLALSGFMPEGMNWPAPQTRDDARVIADWFEEQGCNARAKTWRQLAEWTPGFPPH